MSRREIPNVMTQLKQWGPQSVATALSIDEARKYCWDLATTHYENFSVVSWAVPRPLRQHFANVYGFCRWADDLGDETGSSEKSLELLAWWQRELDATYSGSPKHPVYVALKETIDQFQIPMEPFSDLISAFVQDQAVCEYDTFEQLLDYCKRSANPVGRIVLYLANRVTRQNLEWSDSICTGLQLANFWQDVDRDQDIGRTYLPREDRTRFGYPDDDLYARRFTQNFRDLMQFEVQRTRDLLNAGRPLIQQMPGRLKYDIALFIRGGLLVLDGIEQIDFNVWNQRPVVKKSNLLKAGAKMLLFGAD